MIVYGPEADRHLFRCLVSSVDFANEGRNSGKEQLQLLIKEAAALVTKPNFISILCYAFEKQESKVYITQLFILYCVCSVCLRMLSTRGKFLETMFPLFVCRAHEALASSELHIVCFLVFACMFIVVHDVLITN